MATTDQAYFFILSFFFFVAFYVKQKVRTLRKMTPTTADFKTMYSQLSLKKLVEYVSSAVTEAYEFEKIRENSVLSRGKRQERNVSASEKRRTRKE